ncbi:Protein MIZU-KUSSEI 1-like, plant [Dillenia turbinata]|uniref:Protein MIZU-KUSSEI 1-like, plant n=1 Tax=Dillenia turbinata TaxID=194707 RepID=A0AAN8Z567_9MAGN
MSKAALDITSKRHFQWSRRVRDEEDDEVPPHPSFKPSQPNQEDKKEAEEKSTAMPELPTAAATASPRKKLPTVAVARLRSVLTAFARNRSNMSLGLRPCVVGTLFGYRHGHVHFAFQRDANSYPAFLIELATPISSLVKEMASGLVRIALECDKEVEKKQVRLLEVPLWRTYCNGKKCGFAAKKECGAKELKILKAVEPISMGAGVLPGQNGENQASNGEGELMYMRAKFERVVGSRDSEAFYMMNPDSNGAPELSSNFALI